MEESKRWVVTKRAFSYIYGRFILRCYSDALATVKSQNVIDVPANKARFTDARGGYREDTVGPYFDAWNDRQSGELYDDNATPAGLGDDELGRFSDAEEEYRRLEEKSLEDEIYLMEECISFLRKKAQRYIEKALRFLMPAQNYKAWKTSKTFERIVERALAIALEELSGVSLPKPRQPQGSRIFSSRIPPGYNASNLAGSKVTKLSNNFVRIWGGGVRFRRSRQLALWWPPGRPPLPKEEYLARRLASYLKRRKGTGKPRGLHVDNWKVPAPRLGPRPTGNQYARRQDAIKAHG